MEQIIAEITRLARRSPDVSQRSGVSVRASVAGYEAIQANAVRRAIRLGESCAVPRISDLHYLIPSLQGKIEFETVEEGKEDQIIAKLINGAVASVFNGMMEGIAKDSALDGISAAFSEDLSIDVGEAKKAEEYGAILDSLDGMKEIVSSITEDNTVEMQASCVELVLEGMHLNKLLNKDKLQGEALYRM
jgi:magnesium chelatase subunit I